MEWLWQDIKFGIRTLLKNRGFVVTATLALALGIGSTTAIFSVIDNVLLEPFPYTDGKRLIELEIHDSASSQPYGRQAFAASEFLDYQEQIRTLSDSIGVAQGQVLWSGPAALESFNGAKVTGNSFQFLGLPALLGRVATPADAQLSAPPTFVMSYKLWQKRFEGDRNLIGKTFTLDGTPRTLIAIMPKRFALWGADLWIPTTPDRAEKDNNATFFSLIGRLKPGMTPQTAQPDAEIVAQRLGKVYPKLYPKKFYMRVVTLTDSVVGKFSETLYMLLAAVGFLLLIACANVANLLLAKATAREKEFAVRSSLGASKWNVVRQLLVESMLLALIGAAAGCVFAWAELKALVAALPRFTFPDEADISLNVRVLVATIALAFVTALLFGLAPALGAFSTNLTETLKAAGRGNTGSRSGRLRSVLIVGEVALSLVLLTGAGLLMRAFLLERQADLGLNSAKLVVTDLVLGKNYKTADQQARFIRDLTTHLRRILGVVSVTGALDFPPFGGINTEFDVAGKTHNEKWTGQMGFIDADFFRTTGIRLLRGRTLTEADLVAKRKVVDVNQTLAEKFFPGENPIGKQIKLLSLIDAPEPIADPWFEIIGITSDVKNHGVRDAVVPEAYGPITVTAYGEFIVYVRTLGNPVPLTKAVDAEVLAMDPTVHPYNTATMEAALDANEFAKPRFALQIFSVFAFIGLVLVSVGVYSVVSYSVSQQSREIGIRLALGATRNTVLRLVMVSGLRLILAGVGIGLAAAFVILRVLKNQLTGISTYDPLTLLGVVGVLALAGSGACFVPSLRATRVDPLISLRYE
jgi:putative ABC transport system permease protein